jgi:hypothetical protein
MNNRTSTLGWIAFMALLAIAVPIGMGSLYTAWRAKVTAALPPDYTPPPEAPKAPPEPKRTPNLRPVDKTMFAFAEVALREAEAQDVAKEKEFRVDLVKEGPGSTATGAKLDLDRDGQFDELWTYGRDIERAVSPADDGNYTDHYKWDGYEWVKLGGSE